MKETQPSNQAKAQISTNAFPMKLNGSGPSPDKSSDYGGKAQQANVKVAIPSRPCSTCR